MVRGDLFTWLNTPYASQPSENRHLFIIKNQEKAKYEKEKKKFINIYGHLNRYTLCAYIPE